MWCSGKVIDYEDENTMHYSFLTIIRGLKLVLQGSFLEWNIHEHVGMFVS